MTLSTNESVIFLVEFPYDYREKIDNLGRLQTRKKTTEKIKGLNDQGDNLKDRFINKRKLNLNEHLLVFLPALAKKAF